jgi:hypothetical protein
MNAEYRCGNLPPFVIDPAPGDAIFVNGTVLQVPD